MASKKRARDQYEQYSKTGESNDTIPLSKESVYIANLMVDKNARENVTKIVLAMKTCNQIKKWSYLMQLANDTWHIFNMAGGKRNKTENEKNEWLMMLTNSDVTTYDWWPIWRDCVIWGYSNTGLPPKKTPLIDEYVVQHEVMINLIEEQEIKALPYLAPTGFFFQPVVLAEGLNYAQVIFDNQSDIYNEINFMLSAILYKGFYMENYTTNEFFKTMMTLAENKKALRRFIFHNADIFKELNSAAISEKRTDSGDADWKILQEKIKEMYI